MKEVQMFKLLFTLIFSLVLLQMPAYAAKGSSTGKLADKSELFTGKEYSEAFVNPHDTPLPNVLIIGDSISIGYTVDVRKKLRGKADVFRIPTNAMYASFGEMKLKEWLGKRKWDVIHFNWGLWDICYRNPKSNKPGHRDKVGGKVTATPEQYEKSIKNIVNKLKQTGAKLIWCATTPVPKFEIGRKQGEEVKYNEIAAKIMKKNNIDIDDLHSYALLRLPGIQLVKGDVHFTQEGYAYLAEKVATCTEKSLKKKN
jgi:hypothetical protein